MCSGPVSLPVPCSRLYCSELQTSTCWLDKVWWLSRTSEVVPSDQDFGGGHQHYLRVGIRCRKFPWRDMTTNTRCVFLRFLSGNNSSPQIFQIASVSPRSSDHHRCFTPRPTTTFSEMLHLSASSCFHPELQACRFHPNLYICSGLKFVWRVGHLSASYVCNLGLKFQHINLQQMNEQQRRKLV